MGVFCVGYVSLRSELVQVGAWDGDVERVGWVCFDRTFGLGVG